MAKTTLGILALVVATAPAPILHAADRATNLETFDAAWSRIQQRYWDPEMGGVDWQSVREELRPRAARAGDVSELRSVLRDMISRLGDSHFAIIPGAPESNPERASDHAGCAGGFSERLLSALDPDAPSPGRASAGLDIRFLEGDRPVVFRVDEGGPAAEAGVEPGWLVRAIDGETLAEVGACLAGDLDQRSRRWLVYRIVERLLHGTAGSEVELELEDAGGEVRRLVLERRVPEDARVVRFGNLPAQDFRFRQDWLGGPDGADGACRVGRVQFNVWMMPVAGAFEEAILEMADAEGLVIDLRGNPGGVAGLSVGLAGYLLHEKESMGTLRTRNDEIFLRINPRLVSRGGERLEPFGGRVAVLVDQFSASTSEIFAAGVQDLEIGRVFGGRTAGMALPAVIEELPNGDFLMQALADLLRPSGERIEGAGVTPDVVVEPTRAGLLAGEDEATAAAMRWICAGPAGEAASGSRRP